MSGRRAIGPGTAAGYGSVAAIWLGQGPAPFGWAAIGGDTATIMFGTAAAGGSRINTGAPPWLTSKSKRPTAPASSATPPPRNRRRSLAFGRASGSIHSYPARLQFSLAAFERLKEHIGNEGVRFQSSVFQYLLKKTSLIFLLDLSQESQFRSRSARRGDMERLISEQP